jgi:hypothetical protein
MTQLLQQALDAVQKLDPQQQNAIASLILDALADDRRWEQAFARSEDKLAALPERVRADIAAGRVRNQGIDEL